MGNPQSEAPSKTVFIIEDFSLESVEDKIVALGHTFQKRSLDSQPFDWIEIENALKQVNSKEELLAVLLFLSRKALLKSSTPEFLKLWRDLLSEIKETASLIFIDEECFKSIILSTYIDQMIAFCLEYISKNLQVFKEYVLNCECVNIKELRLKIDLLGDLSVHLTEHDFILEYNNKKRTKKDRVILRNERCVSVHFLIQIKYFVDLIRMMRHSINNGSNYINILELYDDKIKAERIAQLLEQFQRNFVEEQTEQSQRANILLQIMQTSGIEIVPYKQKKEISLRVHHFLDEIDKGIFFHLYIPNGRYQEDQLASFLRLFESYLQRVEKLQFFIDTKRTLHGTVYEFKNKNMMINLTDMEVAFSRFESFMNLCQNDQKKAGNLLLEKYINPSEASRLMTKYVKEYQRLLLDIEHEKERKMLDIRQKLESEVFELTNETNLEVLQTVQPSALLALSTNIDPVHITISNSSVNINSGIQSFVEQAIYGDIHYTTEDKELFTLFEQYTEHLETVHLKSELQQLKDTSTSETDRKTAKQKIVGFLYRIAPSIGQSTLTLLTAYLEKVLIGP